MSITEHPHYDDDDKIGPIIQWLVDHGETEAADNLRELRAAAQRDASDAATMRGFINTHHMTPAMVVSLMMHWQRRALSAEAEALAVRNKAFDEAKYAAAEVRPKNDRSDWTDYAKDVDHVVDMVITEIEKRHAAYSPGRNENGYRACPECGAPAGMDCRSVQGRIPPHASRLKECDGNEDLGNWSATDPVKVEGRGDGF